MASGDFNALKIWGFFQITFCVLSALSKAEPEPWYYFGGPGYYHGHYSSGFKQYPSYYYNQRRKRSPQQHVTNDDQYRLLGHSQDSSRTYYVALLEPYRDITHYGYPHYYSYSHPIHLNYIGGQTQKTRYLIS